MRCPKCRCGHLLLDETIEEIEHREVVDGVLQKERLGHSVGSSLGWEAVCQGCGHTWKPRASTVASEMEK